jgi:SAM-dependent methyltransferase
MVLLLRAIAVLVMGISLMPLLNERTLYPGNKAAIAESQTPAAPTQTPLRKPDVMFVPTPPEVVDRMLTIANVNKNDILYDLGSGDGRIPITAVRERGVQRAVGIDINPKRIRDANARARRAGIADRVQFLNQDLFESNFKEATVVTLYLLPKLNVKLRPQLLTQLKPGSRVVSHNFDMGEWAPERTERVDVHGQTHTVYLWTIPANPPGNLL